MEVFKKCSVPPSVFTTCCGDGPTIGSCVSNDHKIPLVCFTGSSKVGKVVQSSVIARCGRPICSMGGNNA